MQLLPEGLYSGPAIIGWGDMCDKLSAVMDEGEDDLDDDLDILDGTGLSDEEEEDDYSSDED